MQLNTSKSAYTILNYWEGNLRWFDRHVTNGVLEAFKSLLQSAKTKACGYHTHKNFINMVKQGETMLFSIKKFSISEATLR